MTPVMTQGNKNLQKSNCWETNRTKLLRVSHVRHVNKMYRKEMFSFFGENTGCFRFKIKNESAKIHDKSCSLSF